MTPLHHPSGMISRSLALLIVSIFSFFTSGAQVSVTATAGTTGPTAYTTLKGAFDAVNAGTHQGAVTIQLTAGTTETATASLNASGSGSALYTSVLIKPATGATPTVSGAIASGPVVKLNGASNVTIDGSNNATTTRDLSITNTSATSSNVMQIGSVGSTAITNVTVKNTLLTNGTNTSTGVLVGDAAVVGSPGYFTNITIQNNLIQKAYIGVYCYAVVATNNGNNTLITGNDMNASGANALRLVGVYAQGLTGATISNNNIGNFETTSSEFDRAIWLATATTNTTVSGNTITGLAYTGTSSYAPIGINVSSGVTTANIDITGNTVSNLTSSGTGQTIGIYLYSAMSNVMVQKNKVSNIKNTNTGGYGCAGINAAITISAANVTILNNFVWDVAAYGTNQFDPLQNGYGMVIDGGSGYTINYNSVWLNTNQTFTGGNRTACLFVTANVTVNSAITSLRNNIFSNTQTIGNGNSRFALLVTAATSTLGSFNYNDYYSTSTNLACQGSNPTIWNTLAQIQTNMTGNANSVSIQPTFTSATDLHLPYASNVSLNGTGLTLAGFTTDIDGDTRTATPDMGADEFDNCAAVTITGQPAAANICTGANASFTVAATNGTVYQWQVNTGSGFTDVTNGGVYSGATTTTLSLATPPATMSGYIYRCVVKSGAACAANNSSSATLTVNTAPNGTVTPSGPTTFCSSSSLSLSVPTGSNQNYQWKLNGTDITGATNNSYAPTASGSYTVYVNNTSNLCFVTSSPTNVVYNVSPAATTTPSTTQTVCNNTVNFTANTGSGLSYQWLLNGGNISNATNSNYVATASGNYSVIVATSACSTTSAVVPVTINTTSAVVTPGGSTTFCAGGNVGLSTPSGANQTYQWKRNGVDITGATNANYTANTTGDYTVFVNNTATGCSATTTTAITVTVGPPPSSAITPGGTQPICAGGSTTLSTNSSPGLSYQWKLDGTDISNATNQTYNATAAGNYTVSVSSGPGCSSVTATPTSVTVNPLPPATATPAGSTSFCQGSSLTINANTGSLSYQWKLNGSNINNATNSSYSATAAGNYTVFVTNTATTCSNTSSAVAVTVNPLPTAVATPGGSTTFCQGNSVQICGSTGSGLAYQWQQNLVDLPGATNSCYTATAGGSYIVKITNTATGCSNVSNAIATTVNPLPSANVNPAGTVNVCSGNSTTLTTTPTTGVNYQWKLNGSNITNATNSSYSASVAGGYTIQITNAATGCSATSAITTVNILPLPTAAFTPASPAPACDSIVLDAQLGTGYTYQWQQTGIDLPGETNASYTVHFSGSYSLKVTGSNGCSKVSAATSVVINQSPQAVITYSSPLEFCEGGLVVLNTYTGGGLTYQWSKDGLNISGATQASYLTNVAGSFTVKITNTTGCSRTAQQVNVMVSPLPLPVITKNGQVLSTGTFSSYQWYLDGQPITGAQQQSLTYLSDGAYRVNVTDTKGCANSSPIFFVATEGVGELNTAAVKLWPNPVRDVLMIDAPMKIDVVIRDMSGRNVLAVSDAEVIDLRSVSAGVYMVIIRDESGVFLKMEKLLKAD